jgi:hypothetical protein
VANKPERAVVSVCAAWFLWLCNWLTINGTFRNLWLARGQKPSHVTRGVSDVWNLAAAAMAATSLFLIKDGRWLVWLAVYRSTAIIISQASVLVNTDWYVYGIEQDDEGFDARRLLLIGLMHYAELSLWFAVVYRHCHSYFLQCGDVLSLSDPWGALYFSVVTMTTLGYGEIRPTQFEGARIVIAQAAMGTFMALVVLGRFISIIQCRPIGMKG